MIESRLFKIAHPFAVCCRVPLADDQNALIPWWTASEALVHLATECRGNARFHGDRVRRVLGDVEICLTRK
ncbi:MAG TPA: hypothetical protein VHV08_09615 [Pirellulales bacterium]|nr:hypothetical protein [Pirellulales bacterium]